MADEQKQKETKLPLLKPSNFIRYRHIYKEYITGKSMNELVSMFRATPKTIREAVSYMTKYQSTNFKDEDEIQIAIDRSLERCEKIKTIYNEATIMKKHSIALKAVKELRNEEALIYNLKGLLGIKIPDARALGAGGINLILPVQLGVNKTPNHMKDVTPQPKQIEGEAKTVEEIVLK